MTHPIPERSWRPVPSQGPRVRGLKESLSLITSAYEALCRWKILRSAIGMPDRAPKTSCEDMADLRRLRGTWGTCIWANYNISLTWIKANLGMISLINHDSQWGRSEVVIIYPDVSSSLCFLPDLLVCLDLCPIYVKLCSLTRIFDFSAQGDQVKAVKKTSKDSVKHDTSTTNMPQRLPIPGGFS